MKRILSCLAVLTLAFTANPAVAQSRTGQEACEGDVYELCSDKIPDEDAIVVCLRRQWSKVSRECRGVMANYMKNQNKGKRKNAGDAARGTVSGY